MGDALRADGEMFQGRREHARRRQAVIAANPGLQERELIKLASLAAAMAEELGRRGIPEPAAKLTAETAVAVFKVAFDDGSALPGHRPCARHRRFARRTQGTDRRHLTLQRRSHRNLHPLRQPSAGHGGPRVCPWRHRIPLPTQIIRT